MRRIASVFKRGDKNKDKAKGSSPTELQPAPSPVSSAPSPSRLSTLPRSTSKKGLRLPSSKITVSTEPPPLPVLDAHHSSSSSSTGSASLQTPDDTHSDRHSHHKGGLAWLHWSQPSPASSTSLGLGWPESTSPSRSSRAVSEDDVSEHSSLEGELGPVEYFAALTSQRLEMSFSAPPLLPTPDSPLFPRSVNAMSTLDSAPSLSASMHRARLLERLNKRDLSQADRMALQAFGTRPAAKAVRRNRRRQVDEGARYDLVHLTHASRGLRRWIDRPYFEERMALWQPDVATGNILQTAVKGSGFAVFALDVSPALEILAGDADATDTPTLAPSPSSSSAPTTPASVSVPNFPVPDKYTPYKTTPSPLRQNANTSTSSFMTLSPSTSAPAASPIPASPSHADPLPSSASTSTIMPSVVVSSPTPEPTPSNASKRGVRFTASVKSVDAIPSDYAERVARQKAEKARFLREEKERREHDAERLRHDEERKRWEDERRAWEREKMAIEEERRRKGYSDELAAARARRESTNVLPAHRKDAAAALTETYTRPAYDERRQSFGSTHSPSTQSPSAVRSPMPRSVSSSRAPSSVASGAIDERSARASRRQSAVSESSLRGSTYGSFGYPAPPVPPVPMMPAYGVPMAVPMMVPQAQMMMGMGQMNMGMGMGMVPMMGQEMVMPLLPPNAPFMMHSNGSRTRSASGSRNGSRERVSSSASRNISSGNSSPNASSERLAAVNRGRSHNRASLAPSSHEAQTHAQVRSSSTHGSARGPVPAHSHSHSHAPRPPVLQQNSWSGTGVRSQPPHSAPIPSRRSTAFS